MTGKLQWEHSESGSSNLFDAYRIKWDLTNGVGTRLTSGVYAYRVIISSNQSQEVSKTKKLIILTQ
jgi:hypothetical protein